MKKVLFVITIMLFSGFMQQALCADTAPDPGSVPRMAKEQLKAQLDNPDFIIVDVRAAHDWEDSNIKITGAIREEPSRLDSWVNNYPKDKTIVLYCK